MRSNLGRSNAKDQCAGVYVAGDITPNSQLAIVAAAEGEMAAIHVHQSLIPKDRRKLWEWLKAVVDAISQIG